jgi:hypothetical protein
VIEELNKLYRTLLRSSKTVKTGPTQTRANIISANLKLLEQRPDDDGLRCVVISQIDDLSELLRRQ